MLTVVLRADGGSSGAGMGERHELPAGDLPAAAAAATTWTAAAATPAAATATATATTCTAAAAAAAQSTDVDQAFLFPRVFVSVCM